MFCMEILSIRGVTKNIALNVEHGGSVIDPWGQNKEGFELTGKISRKEFGLKWNALTEAGGAVVSDDVRLILNVQMVKQAIISLITHTVQLKLYMNE